MELLLPLKQRAQTAYEIERAIWRIWGYCRDNSHSLDSERHCNHIKALMEHMVQGVQLRLETLAVDHNITRKKLADARKTVAALEAKLEKNEAELAELVDAERDLDKSPATSL